jgi:hypothetical protein
VSYILHLIATQPSHGDAHVDPVSPRTLGTYDTESAAQRAGRAYLSEHPSAWLQTQDSDAREGARDVEAP